MNTQIKTITPKIIMQGLVLTMLLLVHFSVQANPEKNLVPDSLRQAYGLIQSASQFWNVSTDSAVVHLQEYARTPLRKADEEVVLAKYELKEAKLKTFYYQLGAAGATVLFIVFYFLSIKKVRRLQVKHDTELEKIKRDREIEEELFMNNSNPHKMFNHSDPERLAKLAGKVVVAKIDQHVKPNEFFTFLQSLGMIENMKDRASNTIESIPYRKGIKEYVLKNADFTKVRKWRDALVFAKDGEEEIIKNFESILSSTFLVGMLRDDKAYQPKSEVMH